MSYVDYCEECNNKERLYSYENEFLCEKCCNNRKSAKSLQSTPKEESFEDEKIEQYRSFFQNLKRDVHNHDSKYNELLVFCPKLFKLLCDILTDKRTDWHTKLLINSALAYFVLPDDIIPDYDASGKGYLDDLFLTSFVLVEIKTNIDESLLKDNWNEDGDILGIIEEIHDKTKIILGERYLDILRLVGLKKYVSLDLNEYNGEYPKKVARLAKEKRELLGLLSFVVSKIYNTQRIRELDKIKEFLHEHEDYDEIERIITIAKERKNEWESNNQESLPPQNETYSELRRRRVERLLKEKRK